MTLTITALNGRLPGHLLTVADTGPNGPQLLRRDAGASVERMRAEGMPPGCLRSGYRTREQQADEVERARRGETPSAAPVGTSLHGEGVAGDWDEPARSWLWAWGSDHGWVMGTVPAERWHGVYDPDRDKHAHTSPPVAPPATTQEDEMTPYIERLFRELNGREGALAEVAGWADTARARAWTIAQLLAAFRACPAERGTVRAAYLRWLKREPSATDYAERTGRQTIGQVWDALEAAAAAGAK